jgi:hypothetical protein
VLQRHAIPVQETPLTLHSFATGDRAAFDNGVDLIAWLSLHGVNVDEAAAAGRPDRLDGPAVRSCRGELPGRSVVTALSFKRPPRAPRVHCGVVHLSGPGDRESAGAPGASRPRAVGSGTGRRTQRRPDGAVGTTDAVAVHADRVVVKFDDAACDGQPETRTTRPSPAAAAAPIEAIED